MSNRTRRSQLSTRATSNVLCFLSDPHIAHLAVCNFNQGTIMSGDGYYEDDGTFLFTSESVKAGHPDKMCDQVSDAVLDALLVTDPDAKVACECFASNGLILVGGEISSKATIDIAKIVRETIKEIGYDHSDKGFDYKTCNVMLTIQQQAPEISQAVHENRVLEEFGAGDQGFMFGYATDETEESMPLTVVLAHALNKKLAESAADGTMPYLRPDGKCQVTIEYKTDKGACVPIRVHTVLLSTQHDENVALEKLRHDLVEKIIKEVIPAKYLDDQTIYHLNPSSAFTFGGPGCDAGLTGRKIIVDTYGGWGAHGGGAFSGKDSSKVDRSAAYAARWVAKSLVKAGLCRRCLVQVAYGIGLVEPLSVTVFHFGTTSRSQAELLKIVKDNFDLRPGAIIRDLDLQKPIFKSTSCYGHFGRPEFPWEVPKQLTY